MEETNTPETPTTQPEKKEEEEQLIVAPQHEKPKTRNLLEICIEYARKFNGYPYISCSLLRTYDDTNEDPSVTSNLAKKLRMGFLMTGRTDKEEFIKRFVNQPIVYIQAHAEMPTLAKDGCYNNINIHGKPFKSYNVSEHIILKPEEFVPFIVVKQGSDKFGKIEGNPYRNITKEEAAAVMHMNQDPEPSKPEE